MQHNIEIEIDGQKLKEKLKLRDGRDGLNGSDGRDGLDGKDGSPDTGVQIVDKINSLDTKDSSLQIDASHIKNLPNFKAQALNVGGIRFLGQLVDVGVSSPTNGQVLKYSNGRWENSTDLNTDAVTSVNGETGVVVLDTDDIATVTDKNYVTDAQLVILGNTSGVNTGDQVSSDFDHGGLAGLSDDDHTQYALLNGRSGGQTLIGDTASGGNLTLQSTSHATKGKILFGADSAYDGANVRMGIGTISPEASFHVSRPSASFLLETTASNPVSFIMRTANASGDAMFIVENSADANNSWRFGRVADGTYRLQYSAAQPFSGATNMFAVNTSGDMGIGTISPDTRLHAEIDTAAAAGVNRAFRITKTTSGTPANGIGTGLEFEVETSAGNNEVGAAIDAVASDVTSGGEDFQLDMRVMVAGATAAVVGRFDASVTAGETRFMIYDVDNGTLERVSVGAADSGGAGYKVLRIPN